MFESLEIESNVLWKILIVFVIVLFSVLYAIQNHYYGYWKRRGIVSPPVIPFFGSFFHLSKPLAIFLVENYQKYGKIHGIYQGLRPRLVVADPNIIKRIMVQDFNIFRNRGDTRNQDRIGRKNLVRARDNDWKRIRSILSPMFTTSKLKKMESSIFGCVDSFMNAIEKKSDHRQPIMIRSITGNFTMDVIAKCAFATDTNAHSDKENQFVRNAKNIFQLNLIEIIIRFMAPKFLFNFLSKEEIQQENELFKDVIGSKYLSEEEIVAQSVVFFLAGYETTATTMAFCCYELAMNQDIQQKLFDEIQSVLDDGKSLNYSSVMTLPYLDAVLSETLRKYPPALALGREAAEDYYIKEYDITVEKNNDVMIPVYAIHHDPEYYPDPERYDPERFMPENRHKLVPYTYLPFGGGPRNCIGMRFALTEAKLGIANLIKSFRLVRIPETSAPLKITKSFILLTTEPIHIGIEKRAA
ncbi:Disks large-like protein [Sarcoptes scabiei]|nr:Disks large-like protein [Sarcoptes scabiei]